MNSKFTVSFAIFSLMLLSCSRYQFVFMDSNLPKTNEKAFLVNNDTCSIRYSFGGSNCPVKIQVYNKLSVPLYIDWKKSALIINSERISLWQDRSTINTTTNSGVVRWNKNYSSSVGTMEGTLYRNEQVSFIPPQSYVNYNPVYMVNDFIPVSASDSIVNSSYFIRDGVIKIDRHTYTKQKSPLTFRCFLAYSTKEDFSAPVFLDNSFWISDIVPIYTKLSYDQQNSFYIRKSTAFGTFMGMTVVVGFLGALSLLAAN